MFLLSTDIVNNHYTFMTYRDMQLRGKVGRSRIYLLSVCTRLSWGRGYESALITGKRCPDCSGESVLIAVVRECPDCSGERVS